MDDHNLLGDFDDCFDFLHYDAFSLFGEESFDFNVESLRTNFVDTGPAPFLEHGIDPNSLNIPAPELGPISADAYSSLKASVPGESNVALAPPSHSNDLSKDSPCNNSDDTKSHAKDTAAIRRSTNSRKRKWHASMGVFPSAPGQMITLRQRRPFDASRRKEVALNRVVGACVQCKLRKSSVSRIMNPNGGKKLKINSATLEFLAMNVSNELELPISVNSFAQDRGWLPHALTTLVCFSPSGFNTIFTSLVRLARSH